MCRGVSAYLHSRPKDRRCHRSAPADNGVISLLGVGKTRRAGLEVASASPASSTTGTADTAVAMGREELLRVRELCAPGVDPLKAGPVGAGDEFVGLAEVRRRNREGTQRREEHDDGPSVDSRDFVDEPLVDQQGQRVEGDSDCRARWSRQRTGRASGKDVNHRGAQLDSL